MAVIYLAGCVCCIACAVFMVTGMGGAQHASGWGMRTASRLAQNWCLALGKLQMVAALLQLPSWRALSDELARRLFAQGIYLSKEGACAALLGALVAISCLAALMSRSVLGLVVGVFGCCVGLSVWHSSRTRARERALIDEMPEVFRTLAMALGSGETLMQAIEYVGMHEKGYAGKAFVQAALRLRCGSSTEEAMEELSHELDAPGVGMLTTALVIAQRTGSPLRGLFQSTAQLVERQGEYERMLSVKTAQVRLSIRIVCLLPLLLVCLLSLISVDFQHGLTTLPGTVSLMLAAAMDGVALLTIRRLMRGVL
ncbi:MAG: type II secretion system F family protein [Atopobiaceae bacterium]|nr:type II secretion system F family protein [Atopobiaceae bacterium]